MNITMNKDGDKLTIVIEGRVDTVTSPDLEKAIMDNIEGVTDLTLDLKDMEYTSSAGLRVFLKAQKTMNKQGTMRVTNVQDDVMDVFEITGFVDILTIE